MDTIQTIELIAVNPKVRGGRPFILGTTMADMLGLYDR